MADKAPLLDDDAIQNLIKTSQDPTGLADTPTPQLPTRLAQRLQWLKSWDTTLAPLLVPVERSTEPFALKPQRVNALLQVWSLGQHADASQITPNSAALLLLAHQGSPNLASAIEAWGSVTLASGDTAQRHLRIDEAQAIRGWLQRWERKDAELAMLQQIKLLGSLTPQDQERLAKLGGDAYKAQLMQVDPQNLRITLRDRVDNHSMERYFRDDPLSAETMMAVRAKAANPAAERLQIGKWDAESFFDDLRHATAVNTLLGQNFNLDVRRVTLVNGDILEINDVCIFSHRSVALKLLLTVAVEGNVAIIQLALLVPCDGMRVSDYCAELLRISDSGESNTEKLARGEIVDKVLQEALGALKARSNTPDADSPVNLAG